MRRTLGSMTKARARATRCCCPPESSLGFAAAQRFDLPLLKRRRDAPGSLRGGHLAGPEAVSHVFLHGQMGENGVILEDHADVPLVGGDGVHDPVAEQKLAAVHNVEARDIMRRSVVLPQPEGPRSVKNPPAGFPD